MDRTALEFYLYLGSPEPIIEWLKKEGCKTREQAKSKLAPIVESNIMNVDMHIANGDYDVSLAGTDYAVKEILNSFPL